MYNHPEHCHDYCCSQFRECYDVPSDDAGDGLQGEIHPIFARENFRGSVDYSARTPSLRLVSKILHCDAMIHFVTTLIDGEIVDYDYNPINVKEFRETPDLTDDEYKAQPWYADYAFVVPSSEEVNLKKRARAAYILQKLSKMIPFEVVGLHADKDKLEGSNGLLGRCCSTPMPVDRPAQFKFGETTTVQLLPESSYEIIIELIENRNEWENEFWYNNALLMERFGLAQTLLHELAHSIQAARFKMTRGYEVFFNQNSLNEAGFTLEGMVFGGHVRQLVEDMLNIYVGNCPVGVGINPRIVIEPWPSYCKLALYYAHGGCIASSGAIPCHEQLKRISTSYIKTLFTEKCWSTVHRRGLTGLHPESFGEWPFRIKRSLSAQALPDPSPTLNACRYAEVVVDLGSRRAHQLCPCPHDEEDNWLCHEYIPPGREVDILATSVEGLVDGTLDLPIPSSPQPECLRVDYGW